MVCVAAALFLISALPGVTAPASARVDPAPGPRSMPSGQPIVLMAAEGEPPLRVPPRQPAGGVRVQSATITINYLADGTTNAFGNKCLSWPAGAVTAFNYAKTIWAGALNSTVPILINACWATGMPPGVLGHSASTGSYRDFSGAPQTNTWYAVALANALAGTNLNGSTAEMEIACNSTSSWYYGTDGATPGSQYDLVSVGLHEIAHGLDFAGSMGVSGSPVQGSWGWLGSPYCYDRFTENGSGQKLMTAFLNNSIELATQLTSNNIYFNGTKANAANGGSRPKLYAPNPWNLGASYVHLDDIFNTSNGGRDSLMTYSLSNGQSIHDPGPVSMGILQDLGWTVPAALPTPTRTNTPTAMATTPTATPVSKAYLPLVLSSYGSSLPTPTATLAPTSTPTPTATPTPGLGIRGHVSVGGAAASGVSLMLAFYNGAAWDLRGITTTTDVSGNYSFVGAPTLGENEAYSVWYLNSSDNTRLARWRAPRVNSYTAGARVDGGSFDVANIVLTSPAPGVTLTLPINFQWQVRTATSSDSYEVDFFDPSNTNTYGWTPNLGYFGSYVLAALPPNYGSGPPFVSGPRYGWYMAVYSLDGGYGESYYYRPIAFSGAAAAGVQEPLADRPRDPERTPPLAAATP